MIDVPDEHVGTVTQALAPRKGKVTDLRPGDTGRTIVTVEAPSRGPDRLPLACCSPPPAARP